LLLLWRRSFFLWVLEDLVIRMHKDLLLSTKNASAATTCPPPCVINILLDRGGEVTIVLP
jgi:hypothetical protein